MKHIIITRIKFDDDKLFQKYFEVMKEVYVPSIKSQTNKNFEIGFITHQKHIVHLKKFFDKNVHFFNTFSEAKNFCINNNFDLQTRHDCDDWMSENYIQRIQEVYNQNRTKYDKFLIHSQVHKVNYQTNELYLHNIPYWTEQSKSGFISSFLTLCQKKVDNFIFNGNHVKMNETTTSNIIYLNENLVRLTVHGNNIYSKIRDHDVKVGDLTHYDISLVVPSFDNTEFITEFINSVKKSTKNFKVELLIGIDACEKTKNFVNSSKLILDENATFYFFDKNVGPYIIRNSLANISKSNNILFVDSDDILHENIITETIESLKSNDIVRFKFYNFKNENDLKEYKTENINPFPSIGQLGIKKNMFMSLNGFEPWICSADSEFKMREEGNKFKVKIINDILYFRRRHKNSITAKKETAYKSKIREDYNNIIKTKKITKNIGKLIELPVTKFFKLNSESKLQLINDYDNLGLFNLKKSQNQNVKLTNNLNLSIIIPTYKNTQFLPECFDSILKSIKDLDCEILVGIDSCQETLKYVENGKFDSRFKFYFFEKNVGPYVIKNTLSTISSSDKLLFFDSDDIMLEHMMVEVVANLESSDLYRPMYYDFINQETPKLLNVKTNYFGYGVFGIKKNIFLNLNGFEGWRCEADNDFLNRISKNNVNISLGKSISFLRRLHSEGLTSHPNTNYHSKLRQTYRELSKTIRSNNACEKLITEPFKEISYNYYVMEIKSYDDKNTLKKSLIDSIKNTKKKVTTEVDYNQINKVILPPIKEEKITSKENLPKNRNELFEKKKNSNLEQLKKLISIKPSRRSDTPNIFASRKKI
jgi:hypothetical protein